ncbi:hypothetical protein EYF80_007492 [Liparis tanakae]|uniref:Uncharacterized protein n=1 Tax=Liparis tanakae TaxID=230148 RepID=A0A4Z2IX92_9TELE|nr:hypothetical protein EYF80_007492 [Liparis tanakae]
MRFIRQSGKQRQMRQRMMDEAGETREREENRRIGESTVVLGKDGIISVHCTVRHQHNGLATFTTPPCLVELERRRERERERERKDGEGEREAEGHTEGVPSATNAVPDPGVNNLIFNAAVHYRTLRDHKCTISTHSLSVGEAERESMTTGANLVIRCHLCRPILLHLGS